MVTDPSSVHSPRLQPSSPAWRELAVVFLLIVSMLYGATYETWARILPADRMTDVADYIAMSHGNYAAVPIQRRYRLLVPAAAGWVRDHSPLRGQATVAAETLPFYIINFCFTAIAALLVHLALRGLGFDIGYSLLGVALFLGSRVVLVSAASPLVDAPYWLAIAAVAVLVIRKKPMVYAALVPLLALTKEPIIAILLLPVLCEREFRRPAVFVGLAVAACTYMGQRWLVDHLFAAGAVSVADSSGATVVVQSLGVAWLGFLKLFTQWGFHDANSAFMALLPLAAVGWWIDRERRQLAVPRTLFALLPLAILYACMSGTLGRQLEGAFPVVIPYVVFVVWRLGAGIAIGRLDPSLRSG